jgi:formylglycine-generating enzyme required for sulfatase activity
MVGNVAEWVADWYSPDYYADSPSENPPGPSSGMDRVLRAGSWYLPEHAEAARAYRGHDLPFLSYGFLGFRCASGPQ